MSTLEQRISLFSQIILHRNARVNGAKMLECTFVHKLRFEAIFRSYDIIGTINDKSIN